MRDCFARWGINRIVGLASRRSFLLGNALLFFFANFTKDSGYYLRMSAKVHPSLIPLSLIVLMSPILCFPKKSGEPAYAFYLGYVTNFSVEFFIRYRYKDLESEYKYATTLLVGPALFLLARTYAKLILSPRAEEGRYVLPGAYLPDDEESQLSATQPRIS